MHQVRMDLTNPLHQVVLALSLAFVGCLLLFVWWLNRQGRKHQPHKPLQNPHLKRTARKKRHPKRR